MKENVNIEPTVYSVYARADENGLVNMVFSNCFEQPLDTDILLENGSGDDFVHVQGKYNLFGTDGTHNYKVVDGAMVETTEEERETEKAGFPKSGPTLEERVTTIEETIANSGSADEMWDEMALAIEEGVNSCE